MRAFEAIGRRALRGPEKTGAFLFLIVVLWTFQAPPAVAEGNSPTTTQAPVTIETRWDSMWGMKYLQGDEELKEKPLKLLLRSEDDPVIDTLVARSEEDETLGTIGLGGSIAISLACLVLPSTQIHLGSLNIAAPYLPVQIPALLIGVAAAFFTNAAGAAQYAAVQRYNADLARRSPLTWDLSPNGDQLVFDLTYRL